MSLYQTVKSAITVRQVEEMYGMEPDRHGMACCPFHSDSDPSMKLNERIIMSLEETYPEHTFSVIDSFDNEKGEGFFLMKAE